MTDIFLSYSNKDRERVRPVRDALASMGFIVFWDIETPTGENWDVWIRRNLSEARVAVVIWTKNSAQSVNVQHEAAIARKQNKLVPAMLERMDVDDFPMGFYAIQAAQLYDWTGSATHQGYSDLVRVLRGRIEADAVTLAEVVRKEDTTNVAMLEQYADAGVPAAQVQLAYCYDVGQGVARDDQRAIELYRSAADHGNADAQFAMGLAYEDGRGVAQDEVVASSLYQLAAAKGHVAAQHNLGVLKLSGRIDLRDHAGAAQLFQRAAEKGLADAQYALGYLHEAGMGVGRDERYAAQLYERAAQQGLPEAQFSLGFFYSSGIGVLQNSERASRLWRMAAVQGVKKKKPPSRRTI